MTTRWRRTVNGCFGVLLLGLLPGCIDITWSRRSRGEPVGEAALAALQPGHDTLAHCLTALGAPDRVFEHQRDAQGAAGMALLWYWHDVGGFGVRVSSPVDDASASFSFDQVTAELPGCVLWFGGDLLLQRSRTGLVGDLLAMRVRPTAEEPAPATR